MPAKAESAMWEIHACKGGESDVRNTCLQRQRETWVKEVCVRYRPVKAGVDVDRGVPLKWAPIQTSNVAELRRIVTLLNPL